MSATPADRPTILTKFLNSIETAGNRLPPPALLFLYLSLTVAAVSALGAGLGWRVTYTAVAGGQAVEQTAAVRSPLTVEGLQYALVNLVPNFINFPPLGVVLVALLGIALAETGGLLGTLIKAVVLVTPRVLLSTVLVLLGILSNIASDVGYVVLIPLGAAVFLAAGRHPLAGLAATFAGVSGGFSANLMVGALDALLGGITQPSAQMLHQGYVVPVTANWFFLAASTVVVTVVGVWVTEKVVAPRLGEYRGDVPPPPAERLGPAEVRGLWAAAVAAAVVLGVLAVGFLEGGYLWQAGKGGAPAQLLDAPAMRWIIPVILLVGAVPGLAYGFVAGTYRSGKDVVAAMNKAMETMGPYLVLAFFAAQFIAWFGWSQLGTVLAVNSAGFLRQLELPTPLLVVVFVTIAAGVNLLVSSASAKWAVLAPVFVPMMMLLGVSPEATQAAYRVGDSVTNIITPLNSYFPVIIVFAQRYVKNLGVGTLVALMLPYSAAFYVCWTLFLALWFALGWPVGPGAGLHYAPPAGP